MVGKEKGTREVFRGPPTRPLTCRPSPAVGCWSGHSESPRLPRASVEFPLLQSLSQVDTAVTLLRLLIHLLWPPTASPERDTGAGGEGAQEKQPQSPLGPAQSLGCPLGSLTASQQVWNISPGQGNPQPSSQAPGWGWDQQCPRSLGQMCWNCALSLEKALLGECSVLREAVLPLPTLLPTLLAVSRGKLRTMLALFLPGGGNPPPAASPQLVKGWEKRKQTSFQNQFVSNH